MFDKTVLDNLNCQIKVVSRNVKTLTFTYDIMTKIQSDLVVNFEMTSKTSTNAYKNVFFNLSTNICEDILSSPLIKLVMPIFDKFAPGLLHKCPYLPETGTGMRDFNLDGNLPTLITLTMYERMDYRAHVTFMYKKNIIATLTIYFKIEPKKFSRKSSKTD